MPVSKGSLRGLDWLNFSIANVQTGFGPFISVYLTAHAWPQGNIGVVLTISSIVALAGQIPAGIMVDAMASKRTAAVVAILAIAGSALLVAAWPVFPAVLLAEVLHGVASCLLAPAIAAITMGLVDERMLSRRFGRNAAFASAGNGFAAALMGAFGHLVSASAVFFLTAALSVPALLSLQRIRARDIDRMRARGSVPAETRQNRMVGLAEVLENRRLLIFCACLLLFHLGNAAMLPLIGGIVTMHSSEWATVLIAACIVVPQILVTLFSPWVGRKAEQWGRKRLLLIGFLALPIRGLVFAGVTNPYIIVLAQLLDGISAAVIGVMLPIVVADLTRGTGHFNAALGTVGTAAGIGASLSSTMAGYTFDAYGSAAAFLLLAGTATLGTALVWTAMPETKRVEIPERVG